jgi:hypothetical protein
MLPITRALVLIAAGIAQGFVMCGAIRASRPASPLAAAPSPATPAASREEIADLRREIARLQARVDSLGAREQPGIEPAAPIQPLPEPDLDSGGDAQANALRDLEEQFSRDTIDSRWALESIDQIERSIAAGELDGMYLTHVDCRSSLCRVELEVDPEIPLDRVAHPLIAALAWQGGGRFQLDDGRALLYLERGAAP